MKTRSQNSLNTKARLLSLLFILVLVAGLTSCKSPDYWMPPKTSPTPISFMEMLAESQVGQDTGNSNRVPENLSPEDSSNPPETGGIGGASDTSIISSSIQPRSTDSSQIETVDTAPILYYSQAGDTLPSLAVRFGVESKEITSQEPIPESAFINPGQLLIIPRVLGETTSSEKLLADSEVVNSPSSIGFDIDAFTEEAGGYLNTYQEWHQSTGILSGSQTVFRAATENSINPRLLLALLEYQTNWVYGQDVSEQEKAYPLNDEILLEKGLYNQLVWAVNQLSIGYYAYREGRFTEITFPNGSTARLAPDLNAGTAALHYYFAQFYDRDVWLQALDTETGFVALYERMFGDPWKRAEKIEPLFPLGTIQPALILPFERNWTWSLTGGPHGAWERDGAFAGLDFGPGIHTSGCVDSQAWVLASASGKVVRTGPGLVVIDLDGDGYEQTGWVLVYLHIAEKGRITNGSWVVAGEKLGHPSCEGGVSTGTHLHFARKYNGEWVPADGPLPFNLGGWVARAGEEPYLGTLTRNDEVITACTCSNAASFITRTDDDP
jgi:murein DD-endopeptidase MepM/ murein hydrolase activator NlpD